MLLQRPSESKIYTDPSNGNTNAPTCKDFNRLKIADLAVEKILQKIEARNLPKSMKEAWREHAKSWYTGNYNEQTGKITLYRYINRFPGFNDLLAGKSDLLPRGMLKFGCEKDLAKALVEKNRFLPSFTMSLWTTHPKFFKWFFTSIAKLRFDDVFFTTKKIGKAFESYLKGENISDFTWLYSQLGTANFRLDPALYWTTLPVQPKDVGLGFGISSKIKRAYRITVELDPDQAFRTGGTMKDGTAWLPPFMGEFEWVTYGAIPNVKVVEVLDVKTGKNLLA